MSIRLRGGKSANASCRAISVNRWMAGQSEEYQRWCGAHEVAHVVLGHGGYRAAVPVNLGLCLVSYAVMLAGAVHGLQLPGWLSALLVAAGAVGTLGFFMAAALITARSQGQNERDADQLAAHWGYPISAAIAADMEQRESWWTRAVPALRTHDFPADRLQDCSTERE